MSTVDLHQPDVVRACSGAVRQIHRAGVELGFGARHSVEKMRGDAVESFGICPAGAADRWDQHANLVDGHTKNAKSVDKPIAGLLSDLKQRGLLERTLVIWSGEFGRTPFAQGNDGRDHNQYGFSMWMAGGGIRGGTIYGATDEFGYKVVENKAEMHDLHATMLHLMGINHEQLTYRFSGRDMRLTDVHGVVLKDVLS